MQRSSELVILKLIRSKFSAIAGQYGQTDKMLANPDQTKINALENQRLKATTMGNGYNNMCQPDGVIARPISWQNGPEAGIGY